MSRQLKIGIVGATGLVGETFCRLLEKSTHQVAELRPFASDKSAGLPITFRERQFKCQVLTPGCFQGLDIVFFSSGDPISREWAPRAIEDGAIAIDNSAAFRMTEGVPLVVPEINFHHILDPKKPQIIANPNCSTIQLVMVLHALRDFGLSEVRVASYQSVSGAGKEGIEDLLGQTEDALNKKTPRQGKNFNPPIAFEVQPKIGSLNESGFCSEEVKIMTESRKILSAPDLKISAFTARVPTLNGHGEAVWLTLKRTATLAEIEKSLQQTPYINYLSQDAEPCFHRYPEVSGHSDAFVSRLRKDPSFDNTFMMWVLADNLYRGAASNGLLIADRLIPHLVN